MADLDREVQDELQRHRVRVGRAFCAEEIVQIHQSPKMHGWIRFCKANHEHNARRLRSEGWSQVEIKPGVWGWERTV